MKLEDLNKVNALKERLVRAKAAQKRLSESPVKVIRIESENFVDPVLLKEFSYSFKQNLLKVIEGEIEVIIQSLKYLGVTEVK